MRCNFAGIVTSGNSTVLVEKERAGVLDDGTVYTSWALDVSSDGSLRTLFYNRARNVVAHVLHTASVVAGVPDDILSGAFTSMTLKERMLSRLAPWGLTWEYLQPVMGASRLVLGGSTVTSALVGRLWPDADIDLYCSDGMVSQSVRQLLEQQGYTTYDFPMKASGTTETFEEGRYFNILEDQENAVQPREVINDGKVVYKVGDEIRPTPPEVERGQMQGALYVPLMRSDSSWYAVNSGTMRVLQCLCVDLIDLQGKTISGWLNSSSDLTCTSATWDGTTVTSPNHALLAQGVAWATEFKSWRGRCIARWAKYKNRGFTLYISPEITDGYREGFLTFTEVQQQLELNELISVKARNGMGSTVTFST